jgi:hypothetical protein
MFTDLSRIADATKNPKFVEGNRVVLNNGPHKYVRGVFLNLNTDVEWATIRESDGAIRSHPVDWMAASET